MESNLQSKSGKPSGTWEGELEIMPPEIKVQQELYESGVQPDMETTEQPTLQEKVVQAEEPVEQKVERIQARNFKQLREQKENAERERDHLLSLLNTQKQQVAPINVEEDYDVNLNPDDLAEGKHLSKVQKKIKSLETQLRQYQQQTAESAIELRIRTQCPDFEKVCTPENVAVLRETDPELAATINSSSDLYNKAIAAYKAIKRYGISTEDNYVADKVRAQQNAAKPRPLASVNAQMGDSPLTKANAFANGLTEDLKKSLWREMNEAKKGS